MSQAEREALIAWSAVAEPGDATAGRLVGLLGAADALAWVRASDAAPDAACLALAGGDPRDAAALRAGLDRWARRLDLADAPHERRARSVGARVVARGGDGWPGRVDDLGDAAPYALYVRGEADLEACFARSVAVVGSRSSTAYGAHMAAEIAGAVAEHGATVISGGAYGIDAVAHRTALACGAPTVAVMAGGVDRLYPAANDALLREAIGRGAVLSEVPPGFAPHRSRFLSRNRLIAAASATLVIEAAQRSGALSTAAHAAGMLRPVGAVPGPATSASSGGCHELIRDGRAVLVATREHALELVLSAPEWAELAPPDAGVGMQGALDFGDAAQRAVFDAASARAQPIEALARGAGLDLGATRAAVGALAAQGLVQQWKGQWRRGAASGANSAQHHS